MAKTQDEKAIREMIDARNDAALPVDAFVPLVFDPPTPLTDVNSTASDDACARDLAATAAHLQVSSRALRLRLGELGVAGKR